MGSISTAGLFYLNEMRLSFSGILMPASIRMMRAVGEHSPDEPAIARLRDSMLVQGQALSNMKVILFILGVAAVAQCFEPRVGQRVAGSIVLVLLLYSALGPYMIP